MRWLASNVRTFLLALILGVAVWVSAVSAADPDVVRTFPRAIPIEIVGQDPTLVLTNEVPASMEVTLRAPQSVWEILTSREDTVRAILDLSGLGAGEYIVNLQVQVDPDARPTQIVLTNPRSVAIDLESFKSKPLSINLSLTGQPAAGYQAGEATVTERQVTISGPESLVDKAIGARVAINLDGVRESIADEPVPVQIVDAKNEVVKGLTVNAEAVRANVPVSQQSGYRDLAVRVVVNGQQAPAYRLEKISVFPLVVTVVSKDPALVNSLPSSPACMIKGVKPGPFLIVEHPDVFWGVIASMYIGNIMLIIINLPLVGIWVQLLRVLYGILAPVVILFTAIGSYSIANQAFDLYALIAFGVLGYALRKLKIEAGPLPLAFILGRMIEGSLRQSLLMSGGSFSIFVSRPISLTMVVLFMLFVTGQAFVAMRRSRRGPAAVWTV